MHSIGLFRTMSGSVSVLACLAAFLLPVDRFALATEEPVISHALRVRIEPEAHSLQAHDRMVIPGALVTDPVEITLNDALTVTSASPGLSLRVIRAHTAVAGAGMDRAEQGDDSSIRVNVYRVIGAVPGHVLMLDLDYGGLVNHPVSELASQYSRGFSESPGLIEARGAFLAGSTHWVPEIANTKIRYRLETDLPAEWKSVSEGVREATARPTNPSARIRDVWRVDTPTEQVHLIAAHFTEYERDAGGVKAYAFLRTPDAALASRYLEATGRYLAMYQTALGQYPYGKFALVENFWETGYGMPSFTLLGEQIIRFPFILTSSYPHELLHNWWGNGVFVDFAGGNWCEGLTAYLADHLIAEQQGQGAVHRRDILARVTDYVTPRNDLPLQRFLSRHDAPSEAIGYGKGAMMWNMLRAQVGDAQFLASLRRFYRDNVFRSASFDDIRRAFERTTGEDFAPFFAQWVGGTGVPALALTGASRSGNQVSVTIAQTQAAPLFSLDVPVVVQTTHGASMRKVALSRASATVTASFDLDAPATRVDVDPQFEVYRRLSPLETPPALSKAFGAEQVLIVVPAGGRDGIYAGLLRAWARAGVHIVEDSEIKALPTDRPVWVIGRSNRFLPEFASALGRPGAALDAEGLRVGDALYPSDTKSLVVVARNVSNPSTVLVYVSAPSAAAADGLARKLPHYGKYSWLVFGGSAPDNEAKGEWTTAESPLTHVFEAGAAPPVIPARKALADLPPVFGAARLHADVNWLAAPAGD